MRVLMISLDSSLLGDPHGNTIQRHLEYAQRIGDLVIVTYCPAANRQTPRHFSEHLHVYPANARPIGFPWIAYRTAARLHRAAPADLVTTQDPFATGIVGLLLKWRFGLPLDMQNHSSFFNNHDWIAERPLRNRLLHSLGRLAVRSADTHRVLTEGEKKHYLAMGIPGERVTVLSTPTHVDLFAPPVAPEKLAAMRASLGIAPGVPVILWVGQPAAVKNVELLLAAFEQVRAQRPDTCLLMVGNFSGRPDFVQRAQAEGVIFAGRVDHANLAGYYQMAEVYTHSSRYEGFGKVLVEALAAGTPVVTTRNDGSSEIVRHDETGLLTDHTPEAISEGILALLNDPARRRAMGDAGQRDVLARFDYVRQLDAVAATFRRTYEITHPKG
ncbi:MAG: glycosyltransferase family 4 protein [Chloroflexi bacterium]|nr:glycosyltransferase family 4 protein [Chloroflexota bacterium]